MVNPCLGDLHTAEDKDQNNQTVVDFLLIDSTFAMEVTWLALKSDPRGNSICFLIPFLFCVIVDCSHRQCLLIIFYSGIVFSYLSVFSMRVRLCRKCHMYISHSNSNVLHFSRKCSFIYEKNLFIAQTWPSLPHILQHNALLVNAPLERATNLSVT